MNFSKAINISPSRISASAFTIFLLAVGSAASAYEIPIGCKATKSTNGLYISVEKDYAGEKNGLLRARANSAAEWEMLTIYWDPYDTSGYPYRLKSKANDLWVSAEVGYPVRDYRYGMLRARSSSIGDWEKFDIPNIAAGVVAIKAKANGKWVSTEMRYINSDQYMLRARSDQVSDWEKFMMPVSTTPLPC